jgi:hypothetical protein
MPRQLVAPASFSAGAISGGTFPLAPAAGIDAAGSGTAFAQAWAGLQGVMFPNNGAVWIWYYNGTGAVTAYALIGDKAAGQNLPHTTDAGVLNVSGYGWLGPWKPGDFNQQDSSAFAAAPGGAIGTAGVGLMCVDFSATANLAVRVFQFVPAA